jgi:hypothetical protein
MNTQQRQIRQTTPIPGSGDVLLVVEYADFRGRWPNLFRVGVDGTDRWESAPPGGPDAYIEVEVDGSVVVARTHYGHTVRLDRETGEIL